MNPFFDRFLDGVEGIPRHDVSRELVKGKLRILYRPNEPMKELQKRLLKLFRLVAPRFRSSYSRRGGRGCVKNARRHAGRYRIKIDIFRAFPSTEVERLIPEIVKRVRLRHKDTPTVEEWKEFLLMYVLTKKGTLPEGAKTSPFLFDWYCEVFLDRSLRLLCQAWGNVRYTRYADDLTFSKSWESIGKVGKRPRIRELIAKAGFLENHRKTRVGRPRDVFKVTGPYTGGRYGIGVSRSWLKTTERMLYQANVKGVEASGHEPSAVHGRVLYLLDVLRGRTRLTSLEEKVLRQYLIFAQTTKADPTWAVKTLEKKGKDAVL